MQSTQSAKSSTLTPHIPIPHDLPALPGSPLAELRASIDAWDHIPTARTAAGSYTRKTLTAAIEADASENDRVIPKFPGQRPSPEQPAPKVPGQRQGAYDDIVLRYGEHAANGCF